MAEQRKIVFTGAPSSGKTTLIEHVVHPHIRCFGEVSREVIAKEQAKGIRPFLENPLAFSEALFEKRLHDYFSFSNQPIHVFDRGIHDVVAYLYALGEEVPCGMQEDCQNHVYDKVFVFPPWQAIFLQDTERAESFEEAEKLHHALVETYELFGMNCIEVPKDSIQNRWQFILDRL